jgi:hypothetical protein
MIGEINFKQSFKNIKGRIMEEEGLDDNDIENGFIDNYINDLAIEFFENYWGVSYDEVNK